MHSCGIIGHRKYLKDECLDRFLEKFIKTYEIDVFNFGTKSEFTYECAKIIEELQKKYTFIKMRVFLVRGEMRFIKGEEYLAKMVQGDKKQIFYDNIYEEYFDASKYSYIKRDQAIIDNSDIIFCYYAKDKAINNNNNLYTKSGTYLAIEYAKKKNKQIVNIANIKK